MNLSIDPVVAAAWGRAEVSKKGPRPSLQLSDVVGAAVEIADREGLGALSMSKVASRLGFTTMSVYRYVASKDELLTHMQDAALGRPDEDLSADLSWREGLEAWTMSSLEQQLRHPWYVDIPLRAAPLMPNSVAWLDAAMQYLNRTPLVPLERMSAVMLINGYVRNEVSLRLNLERGVPQSWGEGSAGEAEEAIYAEGLEYLTDADNHPALAQLLAEGMFSAGVESVVDDGDDFMLQFGLQRILDGLERLIDSRA